MGLDPGDDNYEAGMNCGTCHASLFNGKTPKYVLAAMQGVSQCADKPAIPSNGAYLLTQAAPCTWTGGMGGWMGVWTLTPVNSAFNITQVPFLAFGATVAFTCIDAFANGIMSCVPGINCGLGGYVTLWWGPQIGPPC